MDHAIAMRPIDDAHSIAGVLHWRLGQIAQHTDPAWRPGPLRSLPTIDTSDEHVELARRAGELIRQRWRQLRAHLDNQDGPLPFAQALGPRPDDPADARAWLSAATAVTAYRERYELPDHVKLLGERPGPLRPDAQAAYDHALLQVDQHLARPYWHVHLDQLQRLRHELTATDQATVEVNPDDLQDAHADAVATRRRWRSTTTTDRGATKQAHERAELVVGALERLVARRGEHDQGLRDHSDQHRRIELALARHSRRQA